MCSRFAVHEVRGSGARDFCFLGYPRNSYDRRYIQPWSTLIIHTYLLTSLHSGQRVQSPLRWYASFTLCQTCFKKNRMFMWLLWIFAKLSILLGIILFCPNSQVCQSDCSYNWLPDFFSSRRHCTCTSKRDSTLWVPGNKCIYDSRLGHRPSFLRS